MNYYNEIKNKLIEDEVYSKVKDYSKEKHTLITHYEVGKLLLKAGSAYGEDIIGNYSNKLTVEVDKKYNPRTLRRMRQLYQFFEKQKWSPLGTILSISHIRQLFSLTDNNEINYYAEQIEKSDMLHFLNFTVMFPFYICNISIKKFIRSNVNFYFFIELPD